MGWVWYELLRVWYGLGFCIDWVLVWIGFGKFWVGFVLGRDWYGLGFVWDWFGMGLV